MDGQAAILSCSAVASACGLAGRHLLSPRDQASTVLRARTGDPLQSLRILNPYPGIFAYYDGRTGERFHSDQPNWLDDGAFTLGVSTYSIIDGNEAIIFDAHITADHAGAVMRHVQSQGVTKMSVVISHFHNDHIAGTEVFAKGGAAIVGNDRTARTVDRNSQRLAADDPPITAVAPTDLYSGTREMKVGNLAVELHNFQVHTPDGTVLYIPSKQLLFAGDTLEDTATFIAQPRDLPTHQKELQRMAGFQISKILPAHGEPNRIAAGGYNNTFINATLRYIAAMTEDVPQPAAWTMPLSQVVADDVAKGDLIYFAQYEEVHKSNAQSIQESRGNGR
ncbi:beta-lactamase domain-containing protein [Colletotrichum musicola]|uniref:Beta-lactamase domain-containing protein n=1 Tax=Colletotrichum musicola TaxID=2175873 RepID=A0A8H6KRQ0_9PEZI|nr:beta-lactamase domain-containing protein [Colletotrichum musicola]